MSIFAPGSLIGKYPIVRLISTGGMGVIYEAVHPVLQSRVVIKTLLPAMAGNEAIADRFRNEALAASRIRDDRLPQIFDIDRLDDRTQYIVMELLDGEDLEHRLAAGRLGVGYAVRVIFEVLEVLHKVHQIGIVHRDITPRNIFLARSDVFGEIPKLLDFGVAHFVDKPSTQPGEILGSPFYMAPEQIHGRSPVGSWSDVFAAGVVLYEALAGAGMRPWLSTSVVSYLGAVSTLQEPHDLGEAAPGLPRGLRDAVMRAIRPNARERFQDAAAFAQAIEPFAADRTTLYDTRRPYEARKSRQPPRASESPPAFGMDATMAVPAPSRRAPLAARPPAAALAGIGAQLAGMGKKRAAEARPRVRLREGERRHVTLMLLGVQIEGPQKIALDSEEIDHLNEQIVELLERQLEALAGHVVPPYGGSLMATFGYEQASEDDAERAVAAAVALLGQRHEINETLREISYTLNLRIGVHSGFVTTERERGRDEVITGATVAAAKALEREAPLNATLVSRETLDLLGGRFAERPFNALLLKGRAEPLEAFEILGPGGAEVQRWSRAGMAEASGFAGRAPQLEALAEVHRRAQARGQVELCLVSGGAGMGKSRLLHELVARLEASSTRPVKILRAQPASAAPYSAWVALLERALVLPEGTRGDATLVTEQLAQLASALDEPRRSELLSQAKVVAFLLGLGGHELADPFSPTDFQGRIHQTLALLLDAIAAGGAPALVVLDNIHRADAASLEILGKVLGAVRDPCPLALIVALRDADPGLKLPEGVRVTRIAVDALSDSEASALAEGLTGYPLSPDAERLVLDRAGGNPLFVEEIVFALKDRGLAGADAAALRSFAVPSSLFGLILSRVDRLEPELRAALRYASVLGVEFTSSLFTAVISALEDERVSRRELLELERRGILASRRELRDEVFAFRQVLVRDAVYSTVLRDNKCVLHQLAAAAIERLHAAHLEAQLPALFHHYSQTDEVERIVHYARLTGRRAVALGAFPDAVGALLLASTLRGRLPAGDRLVEARALFDLGTALFWLGRLDEASERVEESVALLDGGAGEPSALGLTLQARGYLLLAEIEYQRARWAAAAAHLEAAEGLFHRAELPFDAAQAKCTRGFQLRAQGRLEEGLQLAREGWATLRGSNDLPAVVRAGHDLGNILRDKGEHAEALAVFARAIEVGAELARSGNTSAALWGQLAARSGRAMTYAALGRLDEAIADQRAVYALAVQEHNPVAQVSAGFHLASHLADKGDLAEAAEAARRSLDLCGSLGMPAREMKCRVLMAQIASRQGAAGEALSQLEAAEELARRSQLGDDAWFDVAELLAPALRGAGEGARAEDVAREAQARAERLGSPAFLERAAAFAIRVPRASEVD